MNQPIETVYQEIGRTIVQSITGEWAMAWITAEVADETVYKLIGRYRQTAAGPEQSFPVAEPTARLFAELRRRIQKEDAAPWQAATFTMRPDGEFELDFIY